MTTDRKQAVQAAATISSAIRKLVEYETAIAQGYRNVTVVNGQVCGLYPFIFTHAIVVGINETGYSHRFCYPSLGAACGAYADWIVDGGDEPKGYIKRK